MLDLDQIGKLIVRAGFIEEDRKLGIEPEAQSFEKIAQINGALESMGLTDFTYMDLLNVKDPSTLEQHAFLRTVMVNTRVPTDYDYGDGKSIHPIIAMFQSDTGVDLKAGWVLTAYVGGSMGDTTKRALYGFDGELTPLDDLQGYLELNGTDPLFKAAKRRFLNELYVKDSSTGRLQGPFDKWLPGFKKHYSEYSCVGEVVNEFPGGFVSNRLALHNGTEELIRSSRDRYFSETVDKSLPWIGDTVRIKDEELILGSVLIRDYSHTREVKLVSANRVVIKGFKDDTPFEIIKRGMLWNYRFDYESLKFNDLDHEIQFMLNHRYFEILPASANTVTYTEALRIHNQGGSQILKTSDSQEDLETQQPSRYVVIRYKNWYGVADKIDAIKNDL